MSKEKSRRASASRRSPYDADDFRKSVIDDGLHNNFQHHQRHHGGKFRSSGRYFLLIGLCACVYACVIYKSFQIAGTGDMDFGFMGTTRKRKPYRRNLPNSNGMTRNRVVPGVPVKHAAPKELRLPKPIINVGFPKAGTSTIFSFFTCNGLKSQHWYCCEPQRDPARVKEYKLMSHCLLKNLINGSPFFEGCGDFDVYSEINGPRNFNENQQRTLLDDGRLLSKNESTAKMARIFFPQHHHLDVIHRDYPNATLILNQRPVQAWMDSVQKWSPDLQHTILNEFHAQNSTSFLFVDIANASNFSSDIVDKIHSMTHQRNPPNASQISSGSNSSANNYSGNSSKVHPPMPQRKLRRIASPFNNRNIRKSLETVYNYHLEYVRDWVARHPSHALVEVDITHEDAGKTLAESFGLHSDCWGHFNKNHGPKKKPNVPEKVRGKIAVPGQATASKQFSSGRRPSAEAGAVARRRFKLAKEMEQKAASQKTIHHGKNSTNTTTEVA